MYIVLTRPNYYTHLFTPPLGLGYLAAYLKKAGHKVRIIDGLNCGLSNQEIVHEAGVADLVGISCMSSYYPEVRDLVSSFKQKSMSVVIGGPHATALPDRTLADTKADYVIAGEGECTFLALAQALEGGSLPDTIPGLLTRTNTLEKREFIQDLDTIPFPDWSQIDPRQCKRAPHGAVVKRFPVAPIVTSRGCPFSCKFCASPTLWAKKIRFRSAENVVNEIEYLVKDFGVKEIHFEDDNLTLKREHIEEICILLLKRNLKISWATPNGVRIESLTPDLVRLMKKSGCYILAFGIESGSQKIIDAADKKTDLVMMERVVRMVHREGIMTQGFFIFGLPGETVETVDETIRFAKKIPLDRAQFLLLDVMPGAVFWDELQGVVCTDRHPRSYQEVTWVPSTISRDELEKAPARAFRKFFLRPRQLYNLIRYIKPYQIPFIIRRLVDFGIISLHK